MQILLSPAILRSDMPTCGEFILGILVSNPGSGKVVMVGEGLVVLFIFQMKQIFLHRFSTEDWLP